MDHRMTFTSNPRIVLLFIVVVAMFAVSVAGFVSLGLRYGFIFLALALFLAYQFGKFALAHARSLITTSDEGIRFRMPTTEQESFLWEKVSCSGYCTQARGKPFLFLYNESDDRLITVPREYSDFDSRRAGAGGDPVRELFLELGRDDPGRPPTKAWDRRRMPFETNVPVPVDSA